ncbi:MAG TPA: Xaa-Pro peptidase family protein [Vicinamibacterales bacterium]|nr:Xaa-Pro peptidase family protein [Vicinamibacterales bacterium]
MIATVSDRAAPNWPGRLGDVRDYCERQALDAFVVSFPHNLTYLCGFRGTAGLLVITPLEQRLVVDGRYVTAAAEGLQSAGLSDVQVERVERRYDLTLADLLKSLKASHVGFEAEHVTVAGLAAWQRAGGGITWEPTERVVEKHRAIKDDFEIGVIRRGGRALSSVARDLARWVRDGRTELDVARDIDAAIERAGFSAPAFPTIVAAGPNSAHPHAHPTGRRLAAGDLVLLDFGGILDGYCVDLTRMAVLGQVDARAASLFDAVSAAQSAAIASVRAGVPAPQVDAAAREVLDARGFGDAFLHGTGHGLGLEVHEAPRISRADSGTADVLEARMVCTIEPGAYLDGFGGVRLEDDVLVTAEGCEVLTDAPRDLLVV